MSFQSRMQGEKGLAEIRKIILVLGYWGSIVLVYKHPFG